MAGVCNFSREIQDSIRDVLDRRVKLYIRRLVRQEGRSDKLENRILVFSACRLFVMSARVPTKVESSIHYLDIQSIESKTTNQLILTVDGKSSTFTAIEEDTDEINHMITHIGTSLKQVFTSFPLERLIKKIEVQPPDRLKTMHDMIRDLEAKPVSPCGGYTMMYACMCDYHGLPYRDEVAWDVDTIYLSQDSKELCLQDFDHLNSRDMAPIISALEHNPWFTKLNANNVRLTPEAMVEILRVMKRNAVIEELCLSGTGMTSDFTQKLATAILSNSGSQLSKVDLSLNPIDERGAIHFIGATSSLSRGLSYLDMSRIKLSGKGLNKLVETLSQGPHLSSTLTFLNLSDNSSKGEDLQYLYNFLAQPNAITHLNLSGTDCALDHLFGAMLRGSCTCVRSLQLSRNTYTHKKMKDIVVQQSWKRFFSSVVALEHLDLSCNKLPPEALKELLLGIASNRHIASLHLDISSNELQTQGAHNLGSCIADLRQITSLDISNNGFDQEITNLTTWIGQNKSLKHLALGRNFSGIKPKHLSNTLDSIVQLIQDDDSAIVSLSLADSRLKSSLAVVVNALGSNVSLTEINLSGNSMGDYGARMLSKALQINNHLQTIQLDKNGLTAQGFEDIAEAMEKNYVLKKMPTPLNDAAAALRTQQERTEKALQRIEELLQRNHSPQKFASDQAYRLQQGFLISSTQQMVDRLVVQVQDNINALSIGSTNSFEADIQQTQDIVKDADNSKQLLPQLQDIAMKSLDAGNPVDTKLREMAAELNGVLQKHIQRTVTDMIECTKSKCSAIMGEKVFVSDMEKGCVEKSALPRDFAKHILDGISTDLYNTLSELNLAVAAHISDRAVDEVITSLSHSHKTLVNHLNKKKQEDRDQVPSLRFKPGAVESPKLTSKKKSLYGRKLRPQSVVDPEQVRIARELYGREEKALTNHHQSQPSDSKLLMIIDENSNASPSKSSKLSSSTSHSTNFSPGIQTDHSRMNANSIDTHGSEMRSSEMTTKSQVLSNSFNNEGKRTDLPPKPRVLVSVPGMESNSSDMKPKSRGSGNTRGQEIRHSDLQSKSASRSSDETGIPKPAERSRHRLKISNQGVRLKSKSPSRPPRSNKKPVSDTPNPPSSKTVARRHVVLDDVKLAHKLYNKPDENRFEKTPLSSHEPGANGRHLETVEEMSLYSHNGVSNTHPHTGQNISQNQGTPQSIPQIYLQGTPNETQGHRSGHSILESLNKSPLFQRRIYTPEEKRSQNQISPRNSDQIGSEKLLENVYWRSGDDWGEGSDNSSRSPSPKPQLIKHGPTPQLSPHQVQSKHIRQRSPSPHHGTNKQHVLKDQMRRDIDQKDPRHAERSPSRRHKLLHPKPTDRERGSELSRPSSPHQSLSKNLQQRPPSPQRGQLKHAQFQPRCQVRHDIEQRGLREVESSKLLHLNRGSSTDRETGNREDSHRIKNDSDRSSFSHSQSQRQTPGSDGDSDGTDPNTKSGSKIVNKIEEAESIESLDDVTELKQVQKLNHIIKDRPKRARSHAPSRPMTRQTKVIDDKSDQEEGLDKFFSKSLASDEFVVISNDKDKDNNKTETSSGTGSESTQSTPDSKKKAGWLKSLGGKKDDKKQSPSLFARNKGFKSSEEKINRISEADEGKSDADKGPVNTTPDPQPAEKSDVLKPPFKKNSKSSAPDKQVDKSDTTADATPQTPPSDTPENTLPVTSDGEDLSPVSPATPDSEPSTETEVKNETEENNEEKKETPSPSSRRYPVGIPKIGHGVNVLAEIKAKQEKRLTIQTSKPKDVKMSGKIKKDETKEEKEEKIPIGLQDSHKSSSDENQSAHSSISSVEDLKTDIEKPSSPAKEERKAPSVSELNNNITNKLSKSLPGNDLSTPKQKTVRQASTDLSVKVKVGMKPPPPMKPRPPPVALKPGKGKPADDDSTENKHETSEQEETSSPRQSKSTVSSPRHSTESSPRHSIESSEASSAKLRDKKPGSDTQSVKDRIKSMELGQALVSDANTTDKANSLPRDVTPGKLKKTDRPSSVHVGRYSNAKAPLKSDLARSSPSLNIDKDNETIYENLKLDMVDDTDIYENLRDSVKNGSLKGNQEVEVKLEGKMDTEDEVDKIKPEKNAEDKTENSEGSATDVILV
ncbi:hypothetical protein ScPMuIL_001135 [Solemya velum]